MFKIKNQETVLEKPNDNILGIRNKNHKEGKLNEHFRRNKMSWKNKRTDIHSLV